MAIFDFDFDWRAAQGLILVVGSADFVGRSCYFEYMIMYWLVEDFAGHFVELDINMVGID